MKYRLLDLITCPHCGGNLNITLFKSGKNNYSIEKNKVFCKRKCHFKDTNNCKLCFNTEIIDALLTCKCNRWYPVIDGIPRMLPDSLKDGSVKAYHNAFMKKYKSKLPKKITKDCIDDKKTTSSKKKTLDSFSFQWNRIVEP